MLMHEGVAERGNLIRPGDRGYGEGILRDLEQQWIL